jgi:fatty acid amide hydrolase 2
MSIESMPLLGIPFTCKECIAVKDMYFTAGLYSRKGTKADEDSQVVKNLREAGAIPIG